MMEHSERLQALLDKLIRLRVQLWVDGDDLKVRGDAFLAASLHEELTPWQAQLRQMLGGQTQSDACLMPLVPDNGAYRIYAFHSLQGSLTEYRYVAQALGPRACFYGFQQTPGVRADSIEALAQKYKEALMRHCGSRPFAVYGVSAGGLVAIETARLLMEAGRAPQLLILGDTFDPAPAQLIWPGGLGWYAWVSFVDAHCGRLWLSLIGKDAPFWQVGDSEKLAYLASHLGGRMTAPWSSLAELEEIYRSFLAYCASYEAYIPEVPTVQCVYISASNTPSQLTARIRSVLMQGRCSSIEVEGRHLDLVRPSGARMVANAIASALEHV